MCFRVAVWRIVAEHIGALVDQLLSQPDFLVGGGQFLSALLNHVLRPLKLGQRAHTNFIVSFHESLYAASLAQTELKSAGHRGSVRRQAR